MPLLVLVSEEFGISTMGRGVILSAFPLGYLCTQMVSSRATIQKFTLLLITSGQVRSSFEAHAHYTDAILNYTALRTD